MQRSARTTDRRGARSAAFSLVEVVVATAIFSTVLAVALQQLNDSVTASTYSTVQADLRRIGQDVLGRIAQDLRSTQAKYVTVSTAGDTITLQRVIGYNANTSSVSLEVVSGTATPVYTTYASPSSLLTPEGYQILQFTHGPSGVAVTSELSRELQPGGFVVKAAGPTSLAPYNTPWSNRDPFASGTTGGLALTGSAFADKPILLAVRVVLRRRTGPSTPGYIDPATGTASKYFYATVNMQTQVQLKASANY